jgi:hypothetical protein
MLFARATPTHELLLAARSDIESLYPRREIAAQNDFRIDVTGTLSDRKRIRRIDAFLASGA